MIAGAAMIQLLAYWPGIMTWDAIRQYGQALSGNYDDWHPPAFEWLWRQLLPIAAGPAPMLVLQVLLHWAGFALLAAAAIRQRRRGLAVALAACGLLPIGYALIGAVLKDSLMAGALLTATGLLACGANRRPALRITAIALILFAATLRFNAFLAGLPLLVALLPESWRAARRRLAVTSIAACAALTVALPLANRLLDAQRSGVELSLIVYDLGGITRYSGADAFPPLPVADPVAVNRRCYSPVKWDSYAWWTDDPCPIGFDNVRAALKTNGGSAYRLWLGAIAAHPIAYAEHRLAHFNQESRFLVRGEAHRPVPDLTDPNPWGYRFKSNAASVTIDRAARYSAVTPLGWPIWWIAVAAGVAIAAPALPSRVQVMPLALSALLYGLGYLIVGVATEERYYLWTMIAALVAATIAAADIIAGARLRVRRLMLALSPLALVTIPAIAWRASAL